MNSGDFVWLTLPEGPTEALLLRPRGEQWVIAIATEQGHALALASPDDFHAGEVNRPASLRRFRSRPALPDLLQEADSPDEALAGAVGPTAGAGAPAAAAQELLDLRRPAQLETTPSPGPSPASLPPGPANNGIPPPSPGPPPGPQASPVSEPEWLTVMNRLTAEMSRLALRVDQIQSPPPAPAQVPLPPGPTVALGGSASAAGIEERAPPNGMPITGPPAGRPSSLPGQPPGPNPLAPGPPGPNRNFGDRLRPRLPCAGVEMMPDPVMQQPPWLNDGPLEDLLRETMEEDVDTHPINLLTSRAQPMWPGALPHQLAPTRMNIQQHQRSRMPEIALPRRNHENYWGSRLEMGNQMQSSQRQDAASMLARPGVPALAMSGAGMTGLAMQAADGLGIHPRFAPGAGSPPRPVSGAVHPAAPALTQAHLTQVDARSDFLMAQMIEAQAITLAGLRRLAKRPRGEGDSSSDDSNEELEKRVSSGRGMEKLRKMRRRLDSHPGAVVSRYVEKVQQELRVREYTQWALEDYSEKIRPRFHHCLGVWRAHHYISLALNKILLEGKTLVGVAYLVQLLKALHQSAIDGSRWAHAVHLLPGADPLAQPVFAGHEEELGAIVAHERAVKDLKDGLNDAYKSPAANTKMGEQARATEAAAAAAAAGATDSPQQPPPKAAGAGRGKKKY